MSFIDCDNIRSEALNHNILIIDDRHFHLLGFMPGITRDIPFTKSTIIHSKKVDQTLCATAMQMKSKMEDEMI